MFILIVGAGRVGSAVAKRALEAGNEVSVLDSDPLSHERLDKDQSTTWEDAGGRFTVGAALEVDGLIEAGIEEADVFLAATRGDNTNLVIAQLAQRRWSRSARLRWRSTKPNRSSSRLNGRLGRCTSSSPEPARSAGTSLGS
jgi:trk system potassium uptake protein